MQDSSISRDVQHSVGESSTSNEATVKSDPQLNATTTATGRNAYIGMRRDGHGRWVRRHVSQKRFPQLAKSTPFSQGAHAQCPANEQSTIEYKNEKNISKEKRYALLRVYANLYEERKQQAVSTPASMNRTTKESPERFDSIAGLPSLPPNSKLNKSPQEVTSESSILSYGSNLTKSPKDATTGSPIPGKFDHISHLPSLSDDSSSLNISPQEAIADDTPPSKRSSSPVQQISASNSSARRSPLPLEFLGELPPLEESCIFDEAPEQITSQLQEEPATPTKGKMKRKNKNKKKAKLVFENTDNLDSFSSMPLHEKLSALPSLEDEISGLFTARTGINSKGKYDNPRPRQSGSPSTTTYASTEEEERIRRFEKAYRAIMAATNSDNNYNDDATIISSEWINSGGKRWSRDPNISSATSVDGRVYDDYQRTPTVSRREIRGSPDLMGTVRCTTPLFDRGATWMVHVPTVKSKLESVDDKDETRRGRQRRAQNRNILLSPCQKKLSDIEKSIHRSVSRPKFDLLQNRMAVAQPHLEGTSEKDTRKQVQTSEMGQFSSNSNVGSATNGSSSHSIPTQNQTTDKDSSSPSTVRISTLRLLFSGIPNMHSQSRSNIPEQPPISRPDKIREKFDKQNISVDEESQCADPIASVFGSTSRTSNYKQSDQGPTPSIGKFNKSLSTSFYDRVHDTFAIDDTNQEESSIQSSDPPHGNKGNEHNTMSMSAALQKLDVADLVRHSLSQKAVLSIIDTDGTSTDITGGYDEEQYMEKRGTLLMSPALLTKRYLQALQAIEMRNWDQVSYLTNADPWLMEMKDLRNDQYLVHVLALFGAGQHDDGDATAQPAPRHLIQTMLDHDPSVATKLDNEGNLALHMAAASANISMIGELGMRFAGAASVQNHDGFLPLHLAIMSCALFPTGEQAVNLILALFHGGVCVKDNDGNTPLHTVARSLKGDIGVDVIFQLTTVCTKLAQDNPVHVKDSMGGNVKIPKHFDDTATIVTTTTIPFTDASELEDSSPNSLFCLAKNNNGDTPLAVAIKYAAGRQIVEALLNMNGGHLAVFKKNNASQTALHLSLEIDFIDASVVLAILKAAPSAAPIADGSGILPIQLACTNCLQREIILAIAIIDLPIDLGSRQEAIMRNGFGGSWWLLVCESNDQYVDIVSEILSLCSHAQKTALCLSRASHLGTNKTAISRATPKCKQALMESLRFLGRFEFTEGEKQNDTPSNKSTHQFSAIDFGTAERPLAEGRRTSLRCYMNDVEYIKETRHLQSSFLLEFQSLFEDMEFFSLDENEQIPNDLQAKHCVSIRTPSMTLARVVAGMPKHHKYRHDVNSLGRYFSKVKLILLRIAKALSHLHDSGIVHGLVDANHIGKYPDGWKLTGLLGSISKGFSLPSSRVGLHLPPEVFLTTDPLIALPTIDIWSFGKLIYEVLVGESLFTSFQEEGNDLTTILSWNDRRHAIIADQLFRARIGSSGIDLVTRCLRMKKEERLSSMTHILQHPFWHDADAFSIQMKFTA